MANQARAQAQPIPQVLEHLIQLNVDFQVLVCLGEECRCAVSPRAIVRHFNDQHQIPIELRKQVERYIQLFPGSYDHLSVQLPPDRSFPQPVIPVVDGFQCKGCPFKSQNRRVTRQHVNREHGKKRARDEEIFLIVRIQSWFKGKRERYWVVDEEAQPVPGPPARPDIVRDVGEESPDSSDATDGEVEDVSYDRLEGEIQQWQEEKQERRLILLARPADVELDPWIQYTKWYNVLNKSKHDLVRTYAFLREPDHDEIKLHRLIRAWKRIFERCLDTLEAIDHKDVVKWWGSPKNEVASQRPFELPQNSKTLDKYSQIWEQFICYVIRTTPEEFEEETETGIQFTREQWECVQRIQDHLGRGMPEDDDPDNEESGQDEESYERARDPELTSELMDLCRLVLVQDTSRISLYDSPLMHYLAVRGFDTESKSFRSSFFYTPILAGTLWISRLILLETAVPSISWPRLGLQSKAEIHSIPVRIHKIRTEHLCEGSFGPVSSILTQLAMGKKNNSTHETPSNIHWAEDFQTIYFGGMPVRLAKISTMGLAMIQEGYDMIRELAFGKELPVFDLSEIIDSMAWSSEFRRSDYSFINHTKNNEQIRVGHSFLFERAKGIKGGGQIIDRSSHDAQWIESAKGAYLTMERRFLRKLMVILHITGGQPARGPELGSVKVSNSIYSARNIYVINGRMCFLTTYDKARKRRGNSEYVVRSLPDRVSQLLFQYLVFVRPFARALDRRESEWLFGDSNGPWAGAQLSWELAKATNKHLGVRLTVSMWRHVAIGIAVQRLMQNSKVWEKDEEEGDRDDEEFAEGDDEEELEANAFDHIVVRQSGHGQRVAQAHYAIDGGFLHRLGPQLISAFERASVAWHGLFGWASVGSKARDQVEEDRTKAEKHGRHASQQLEPARVKRGRLQVGRRGPSPDTVRDRVTMALQRIYGPDGKPQSEEQASALQLVHDPPKTSIIVLPTSSGKSVLFFSVAAMMVQQTVVVVVPFHALVDDLITRGCRHGLSTEEWTGPDSCHEARQLVIVSADRAVRPELGFLHWATGLELTGQLAHVFFDEGHVAFTDRSYRARLRELWRLRYLDCPFTVLTATLIVQLEGMLRDQLLIPDAVLFRRSTVRPTIQYQVVDSQNEMPSKVGIEIVRKLGPFPDGKRGVVYVRSYATGEMVSQELDCPFYKATADQKGEVLEEWRQGSGGWIVATGALGTGINIPGIIYVVHIDRPYGLTSFVQQSGRGGRGGEISQSIIVIRVDSTHSYKRQGIMSAYSTEQIDEDAMTEFVQSRECRRVVLGQYLDGDEGIGRDCRTMDWAYCDICRARSHQERDFQLIELAGPDQAGREARVDVEVEAVQQVEGPEEPDGRHMIATASYESEEADEQMFRVMRELQQQCIYCMLIHGTETRHRISDDEPHGYNLDNCFPAEANRCGFNHFQAWRKKFVIPTGQDCFTCGLSQQVCRGTEDRTTCEYPHIVFQGMFILHQRQKLQAVAEIEGFQGSYETDIWEWFQEMDEGLRSSRESNWMKTWRQVCNLYVVMQRAR
jgi:superfamily II DNA helicase RecQ